MGECCQVTPACLSSLKNFSEIAEWVAPVSIKEVHNNFSNVTFILGRSSEADPKKRQEKLFLTISAFFSGNFVSSVEAGLPVGPAAASPSSLKEASCS